MTVRLAKTSFLFCFRLFSAIRGWNCPRVTEDGLLQLPNGQEYVKAHDAPAHGGLGLPSMSSDAYFMHVHKTHQGLAMDLFSG